MDKRFSNSVSNQPTDAEKSASPPENINEVSDDSDEDAENSALTADEAEYLRRTQAAFQFYLKIESRQQEAEKPAERLSAEGLST